MRPRSRFAPLGIERWFLKMEAALAQRQNVCVVPMADGTVIAITKYADMDVYLAKRELVGDIRNIVSHMRAAAAQEPVELDAAVGELEALLKQTRELIGVMRAAQAGY